MLTPYDEYPVHQAPKPFSFIPNTDLSWSDGMWHQVYHKDAKFIWETWMRVYPNSDIVDACVAIMFDGGQHYAIRMSRQWRPECNTVVGPLSYRFDKPFKEIQLTLAPNEFDMTCDLKWIGLSPAFEEMHHHSMHWGRTTTDQTRWSQNGTAEGWIEFRGERIEVRPENYWACRDHSWGIYGTWSPYKDRLSESMPPKAPEKHVRAFRCWVLACFDDHTAFYHWHESEEAEIVQMNDVMGTPFEGRVDYGWGEERPARTLVDVSHELEFHEGTRMLKGGLIRLVDEEGKSIEHEFRVIGVPMNPGFGISPWKDGRGNGVYRGEGVTIEDDEADLRVADNMKLPDGRTLAIPGAEYICEFVERSEDGEKIGRANIEFVISGKYARYGFEK